jgi:hypothetical protein
VRGAISGLLLKRLGLTVVLAHNDVSVPPTHLPPVP